jgi:excisionase family DNA binding protein
VHWLAPGTAPRVPTTPTTLDLTVLYGGRGRLLRVAEVAEQLGVCNATVYRLCESGDLLHVRVVNSIRVRPKDLAEYMAGGKTASGCESLFRWSGAKAEAQDSLRGAGVHASHQAR